VEDRISGRSGATEIKKKLPGEYHIQHRSRRGLLTRQGELKRTGLRPAVRNHTLAMMRDDIRSLTRCTWLYY